VAEIGDPPRIEGWREKGLRYMTVQIFDCDEVTAAMERAGVEIGMSPRTIGQVRYSFARDPDGNWIELSERASLTGKPIEADR
jgi:predicted enzyme related to lactoylglutathione lyase